MFDLVIERSVPALNCHFVGCHAVWRSETQKQLTRSLRSLRESGTRQMAGIKWQEHPVGTDILKLVQSPSFAVIQIRSREVGEIESRLKLIHELSLKEVAIAVVGDRWLSDLALSFRIAGAVAVVTDIFGCDKLASVILGKARNVTPVVTSWRNRFVNRLPWNPV